MQSAKLLKVFWSHAWGEDEEGRDNHARVIAIGEALLLHDLAQLAHLPPRPSGFGAGSGLGRGWSG